MKTMVSMDKVGRLVLPQRVREAIGVHGPMHLTVEVIENTARISAPESEAGPIVRKKGRRIYAGPLPQDWDSGEAVTRTRSLRTRP